MNCLSFSSCVKLLTAVLIIVQCSALPVHRDSRQKIHSVDRRTSSFSPTPESNSQVCSFTDQSCHFYSHCIDRTFNCGPSGFAQAYAKPRCDAISFSLEHSQDSCDTCIGSIHLYEWMSDHETCFKKRLQELVSEEFEGLNPDPPHCLQLERRGLEVMHKCYNQGSLKPSFCTALNQSLSTAEDDLRKIATHFSLGNDFYAPKVERGLGDLVKSCGVQHQQLADALLNSPAHAPRVVFCTFIEATDQDAISDILPELIAETLDQPANEFVLSGVDEHRRCQEYDYPDRFSIDSEIKLYFVTWNRSPLQSLNNLELSGAIQQDDGGVVGFFEFSLLRSNDVSPQCGDGRRQAGEVCDTGICNGAVSGDVGCWYDCSPITNTECSTNPFELSSCWLTQCGDGIRSASEECDDANTISGDGCSSSCTKEPGYECSGFYNSSSECTLISDITSTTYPPATTQSPPSSIPLPVTSASNSDTLPPSAVTSSLTSTRNDGGSTSQSPHLVSPTPPLGISAAATSHLHSRSRVLLLSFLSVFLTFVTVSLLSTR